MISFVIQLHEINWKKSVGKLKNERMDAACFLYDVSNPDSFAKIAKLYQVSFHQILRFKVNPLYLHIHTSFIFTHSIVIFYVLL